MSVVRINKQVALTVAAQQIHVAHFQRHCTIKNVHICNVTAGDVLVRVCILAPGGSFAQPSALLWDFTVPGNDFLEMGEGLTLLPDYSLEASAAADDSIVLTLAGLEE